MQSLLVGIEPLISAFVRRSMRRASEAPRLRCASCASYVSDAVALVDCPAWMGLA
jgi:hypothetical protein